MENPGPDLSFLLRRGGVFYRVPGTQPREALEWLVGAVCGKTGNVLQTELLLNAVLEREELMPTAMGNGIALPHPRNPVIERSEDQFAVLGFLENPLDWKALDNRPVDTVILAVSSSAKMHLSVLQRITFFCRNEEFCRLMECRAPPEEIFAFMEHTEKGWA